DTTVHFISAEELARDHSGLAHGGFVFRSGTTGMDHEHNHVIEFSLKLDSNPEFTTSVIIAYARAIKRLADKGETGCKTVFDIPPVLLSEMSPEEMRSHLL
ncbi:MAG: diaminopimelate dehydrogenase, partial [Solobacterium sp.]|nr:diaminopimelate dehydrogenase [Solobacterium sp.]